MKMSNKEYAEYVRKKSPPSPIGWALPRAFFIGGAICVLGQLVLNGWKAAGFTADNAAAMTSISLIFLGAVLTGTGVYGDLGKLAGAGTLVPITGFANSVVSPALEFRAEGLVTGTAAKMFAIAGPVIVYGTVASIVYGVVYYFVLR